MQYSEDYTWPLTSSTTIYSGARRLSSSLCLAGDDDDEHDHSASATTRLATEYNTVQVPITKSNNNNNNNNNNNSITSSFDSSVAYHDEQYYVVGYDSLKEWEVLILLNRSEDNKKDGQQATTRTTTTTTTTTTGVADAAVPSMAAMTTSSTSLEHEDPSSSSSQPNTTTTIHRRYPSEETDVIASTSLTANTHDSAVPSILSDSHTTATMGLIDEHSVQPITASATTATIVTETTNNNNNPHTPSRAKILLRNRQTGQEYQQALSTRPLAPTLCLVDNKHVLLWLGNADLNVLQLWYPSSLSSSSLSSSENDHDHDQNRLVLYPNVPLEVATVTSPVMAVDVLLLENLHNTTCALALACQNGTIQLSVFTIQCQVDNDATEHCSVVSLQFTDIQHVSVVVDGPIVSVHLQNHLETIQAVAGSLCGYVCEMVYSKHTRQWSRPYMVAEGFTRRRRRQQQRQQQSEEDSVLSVHAFETFVFVGTFTGKCLVYEKTLQASADDEYQLLWQCQLPYSVHQIVAMSTTRFVVTTRRSVHLFGGKRIHYDVELAHQRLCELLRERKIVPTVVESQVEATVVPAAETTTSSSEGTGATQLELTDTQEGIEIKSSTEHVTTVEQ